MLIKTIKEKYNTEIALIILCCRHFLQTPDNDSVQIFLQQNKINWKEVYRLSEAHRIRPVVYKILSLFKEITGQENLEEFRNYCFYFNAFALNNKRELNRIIELLKHHSVQSKAFKGIDFAEPFYGETGIREFSDNDIIIEKSDIEPVIEIMIKEGYHSKDIKYYNRFSLQYIRDYKELLFEKGSGADREFAFEFHYKPCRYFQGYASSFAEVLGKDYLIESNKHNELNYLKLMTINNGLTDFYPNIRSVLDLAIIFKKKERVTITEIDPMVRRYANYGVIISNKLFNYPIISMEDKCYDKSISISNHLFENILTLTSGKRISILKYMFFNIKNSPSIKYTLIQFKNYILLLIRPNLDDINSLNLSHYFLYYFTKPFRILSKILTRRFIL